MTNKEDDWVETPHIYGATGCPRIDLTRDAHFDAMSYFRKWTEQKITPNKPPKFYLVFNPQQSAPKYQHKTLEEAKTEAIRIAAKYPKQKVYVLETVACYTASVDVQEVGLS